MAADPTNVSRLKNITFAGSALGYAQNVTIKQSFADDMVMGEGNLFPQGILTTATAFEVEADFLNAPNADPSAAPGSIVINDVLNDGTVVPQTITLMKPRDWASSHTINGKTMYHQKFVSVGTSVKS